ncbi:MAG: hypothetical protein UY21_C0004G0032 [Microgenomates group bacterium GW2011_GWA1_48_10]|nr:MAG: hypothetical protein UY21_C0004G0032 [Microgenomates group bacterium GW2011_GWA1_48_10]
MIYKALCLKQPYANWVASGKKTIETRRWKTDYRGDILICSSKTVDIPPAGFALCLVELVDIIPMEKKHEKAAGIEVYDGAYAWMLRNLRPLKSIFPVKGQLGLFNLKVDPELF